MSDGYGIGALEFLAIPVELFATWGTELRRRAGPAPLVLGTVCNGYHGYATVDTAIERRTYEASGVPRLLGRQGFARGVGRRLVEGAMRVLDGLDGEGGEEGRTPAAEGARRR